MIIGTFTRNAEGVFEGTINTLLHSIDVRIVPIDKTAANGPDFRVYRSDTGTEVGAGWEKKSKKGTPYGSINIDDPSFKQPIWTALTKDDSGAYNLQWSRPRRKEAPQQNGKL